MLTKGMTADQMDEMITAMAWEILDEEEYEAEDGSTARALTVWQEDHAVGVDLLHGVITYLQYVPAWAL